MSKKKSNSKKSYSLYLLFAVFVLCTNATITRATNVTMAEVEDCLVNESGFMCDKKKIVSVDVSYGVQATLEAVQVTTIQKDGEPTALEETIEIEIQKSQPLLIYPLTFYHTVPYFPYEEVIKVLDTLGCIDCADAVTPTAGWTYQGSYKVPHSQGFCVSKLLDPFYNDSFWRGEDILGEKAALDNPFSTAHAMRLGELYFHGYEVGEPLKYYEIKFTLKKGDSTHEFTLTPNDPFYAVNQPGGGFRLKAELVGDSVEYKRVPELNNHILYLPSSPDTHPFVQDYQHNMLLIPREEVSKDGGELDKPGVSFYAFRKMMGSGDARVTEAGDGLHNQLFHKHNSDLQKLIQNEDAETNYLVHGKKDFKGSMEFKAGMKKYLEYRIPEIDHSKTSFTMDLETLKVVNTESLGIIVDAGVKPFTSMSEDGTLVAEIQNYGDLKTDYVVTVTEMNQNIIHAIPAQAMVLEPLEKAFMRFDVQTAYNMDTTNEFLVSLKSPTGRRYDETVVVFDTLKHHAKYSWDLQERNEDSKATIGASVLDVTPPVIVLNSPDDAMALNVGDTYVDPDATATDNADGIVPVVVGGDVVDTSVVGTYVVTYNATDNAGNAAKQITRTVVVRGQGTVDSESPVIMLIGADPVNLKIDDSYLDMGAIAIDNEDGFVDVVVAGDTVNTSVAGVYTITYDAADISGNAAVQVTRTVTVTEDGTTDVTAPQLLLSATPTTLWPANGKMVKVSVTMVVTDDTDPSPSVSLVDVALSEGSKADDVIIDTDSMIYLRADNGTTETSRTYTLTYRAVDASGNSTEKDVTITVPHDRSQI